MSKPRRRKQKKQVKPELKLRQFAATELSDQLAAQHSAADLPRFMVDTVAGAYAPADAELMIEGFGAPSPGTQTPLSCPRPRFPICGISTSTATARSTCKVCRP